MISSLAHIEAAGCDLPLTRRGLERRMALLLSANALFLDQGYDAVSLDDIVQHAGGSKTSIYKYFGNKEGLFTAICDYRRELFFKDLCSSYDAESFDLKSYLINTLFNFYSHIKLPENVAFIHLVMEQAQRNSELAMNIHQKGPKEIQAAIATALQNAHKDGVIVCEHPLYSAQLYFGILRNIEWQIIMDIPIAETDDEITKYITYCVDRFLDAHQKV